MTLTPSVRLPFLPLLGAAILCGCSRTPAPTSQSGGAVDTLRLTVEPIEEVARASSTGIEEPRRTIVRTEAQWRELWGELAARVIPPSEPPAVDFDRRMVIVAAMGRRPTGGYSISIEEVRATADSLHVSVVETSPGPGCLTTQALTAPVAAVSVERHPGAPVFLEREETRDCG